MAPVGITNMNKMLLSHHAVKILTTVFFILMLLTWFWLSRPQPWATAVAAPHTTIHVTTTDDELNVDGDCSLREAIRAANLDTAVDACPAGNGADIINIPAGVYHLTIVGHEENEGLTGDIDIKGDTAVQGAGAAVTIIHQTTDDRVLEFDPGLQASISGLTISGGQEVSGAPGGGILSQADLVLSDSIITGNTASSGGGVWNSGSMTISRSLIANNNDSGNNGGGGLGTSPGATVTMVDSVITGNVTAQSGGGLTTFNGVIILINSTVSHNNATGGNGRGAGIFVSGAAGQLHLMNSTVSSNTNLAGAGGGVYVNSGATAHLYNATIAHNQATNAGGLLNQGVVQFQNSLIANNTATVGSAPDCAGTTLDSGGYNLIGEDQGCNLTGVSTGVIVDVEPLLGPLQPNGGETATHGLLYGSPARDAGNPAGCAGSGGALTSDQRGFLRPVNGVCDIGAFESGLANLALTITDVADPVALGDVLTYTITVHNGGAHVASGVYMSASLPGNAAIVSATPAQGDCVTVGGSLHCALGNIANGNQVIIPVLLAPLVTGTMTLAAEVSSNEIDTNLANNQDSESTTITPPTDLAIIKTVSPDPAYTGAPLTYQLHVFAGPTPVTGVMVSDPLPPTFDLDSVNTTAGSCSGVTTINCNLGNLAAHAMVTVTIVGTAVTTDTLVNTATVNGSPDPNPNNNAATAVTAVLLSADLALSMTDDPDPVAIGSPLTYTLHITNNGSSEATGVMLVDTLPFGLLSVSTSPGQGSCSGDPIVTCHLGVLASGASVTVLIHVTSPDTYIGPITNSATVTANEGDPDTGNNLASQTTTVIAPGAVDLQMNKIASARQVLAGSSLVYTLRVVNLHEKLAATNVLVTEHLPKEVTLLSFMPSQGSCSGFSCTLGTIPAGGSATILVSVTVDEDLPVGAVLVNQANVSAEEFDGNPGNNFDGVSVTVVDSFLIYLPVIVR